MTESGEPTSSSAQPPGGTPPQEQPPHGEPSEEQRTRIIRRAPTGPIPVIDARTTHISAALQEATRAAPLRPASSSRTAVASCAVGIVSGWATSVVATDLITGWWRIDRLFCLAIVFLTLVFAIATVCGVILLLQRRALGRYLIVAGGIVALLTYGGLFIAGARVAWVVHTFPVLPIAAIVLALHPHTTRWLAE